MIYLADNLTKYMQNLYAEGYRTQMEEIKEDLNKYGDMPYSWISRPNIKISILPTPMYSFNAIPIKILARFLIEINKVFLKFIWEGKDLE